VEHATLFFLGRTEQDEDAVRLQARRQAARNDIHLQAYNVPQAVTAQSEREDRNFEPNNSFISKFNNKHNMCNVTYGPLL
jgi:hypothetical protein